MYPGAICLMGHKWTLDEKYPGTVSCDGARCCKMAHDMVPEEVKIVYGPFLPLCQMM